MKRIKKIYHVNTNKKNIVETIKTSGKLQFKATSFLLVCFALYIVGVK